MSSFLHKKNKNFIILIRKGSGGDFAIAMRSLDFPRCRFYMCEVIA